MTSVLILAGSRNEACPLCAHAGVSSKALLKLAGVRMIDHVLRALRDTPELSGTIWVSGLCTDIIANGVPEDLIAFAKRLRAAPIGEGPARATLASLEAGAKLPLLITTCDHPLLTSEMIKTFLAESYTRGGDFSVGLATRPVIQAAYPDVKRTYIKLGGSGYSGCNLFFAMNDTGRNAVKFWRDVAHDRKRPLKIAQHFGYGALVRILFGRLGLAGAFMHGSKRVGAQITPVIIPIAEAAIDVDKLCDLALAEKILEKRANSAQAA